MRALLALPILFLAHPAFAHHPMGGEVPGSFATGLLSGLGHPIIGLDHLAFLLAAGLLAAPRARTLLLPLAFILASAAGTVLHLFSIDLPGGEIAVALSVLALGLLLFRPEALGDGAFAGLLAVAGLFHGYAFGESILGAETTPLLSYLAGLVIIQYALTACTALIWQRLNPARPIIAQRVAGAAASLVGIAFLASNITG